MPDKPIVLLVDNGSLQPASTLNLRRLAAALSSRVGAVVSPVSLLHSSAVDASLLGGEPAEILEPALRRRHAAGLRDVIVLPLFFGPSAALTEYIPERLRALAGSLPGLRVRVGMPLADPENPDDRRLASMLADHVRTAKAAHALARPAVIMVDHGSPQPAVGALRDRLACQLAAALDREVESVTPASMERRDDPTFDFNEPLLERALARKTGDVVVSLLFFSPGRHAGPDGDIEQICRRAMAENPALRTYTTPLVGEHPGLVELLEDRLRACWQ